MSTPIISRELRQMVASIRRDKATGYIALKHQELGKNTQGLMQFVEGKLAYVTYNNDKNKDALERIKELTNPELTFGEGLSQGYLSTLDQRTRNTSKPAVSKTLETTLPTTQTLSQPTNVGSSNITDPSPSFTTSPTSKVSAETTSHSVTADDATGATQPSIIPSQSSAPSDSPLLLDEKPSFTFEDHTGSGSSSIIADNISGFTEAASKTNVGNVSRSASALVDQGQTAPTSVESGVRSAGQNVRSRIQGGANALSQKIPSNTPVGTPTSQLSGMPTNVTQVDNATTSSRLPSGDNIPWNKRLDTNLLGTLIGLTLLIFLAFGTVRWFQFHSQVASYLDVTSDTITQQLANHLSPSLYNVDTASVNASIRAEMASPDIVGAKVIYAGNNEIFASWQKQDTGDIIESNTLPSGDSFVTLEQAIFPPEGSSSREALGTVQTVFQKQSVTQQIRAFIAAELLFQTLLAFVLILATMLFLRFSLINRILQLTRLANAISTGQTDIDINITSKDEIGSLANAIKRMQASLQFAMRRLRR